MHKPHDPLVRVDVERLDRVLSLISRGLAHHPAREDQDQRMYTMRLFHTR
jgi:hypothetical protein